MRTFSRNIRRIAARIAQLPGIALLVKWLSNKDVRQRLLLTIGIIVVYRLLANIPLPGIDMQVYQQQLANRSTSEVSYFLTIFTGGLLDNPSIVGLGIGVYITASIVIQLLSSVIPYLEELTKEGARGKEILDRYTRFLALPLSLVYSTAYLFLLANQNLGSDAATPVYLIPRNAAGVLSVQHIMFMALLLAAGSMLTMWLAELITERGLGNGASLIIMIGILASIPAFLRTDLAVLDFSKLLTQLSEGNFEFWRDPAFLSVMILLLGSITLIACVVFVTESTRKLSIQYARRQRDGRVYESHLPLKLNQSGVLPIIFASALLTVPQLFIPVLQRATDPSTPIGQFATSLQTSFLFDRTKPEYNLTYFVLIVIFSLFYAFIALKPNDVAENLQKSGGFIPGVRPGNSTAAYITKVMLRLTIVGAVFLGLLALIPVGGGGLLYGLTGHQFVIFSAVGGTSVLIVIGVLIETMRQVQSLRSSQNYDKYM